MALARNRPPGWVNWTIPACSPGGSGVPGLHGVMEATSNSQVLRVADRQAEKRGEGECSDHM